MNARQKAKHYKKLYERTLATTPVPYRVHNFKTDFIKAYTVLPYEVVKYQNIIDYEEIIKERLARNLAEEVKKIMDIETIDYPEQCCYKVYGSIRVVTGVYY